MKGTNEVKKKIYKINKMGDSFTSEYKDSFRLDSYNSDNK